MRHIPLFRAIFLGLSAAVVGGVAVPAIAASPATTTINAVQSGQAGFYRFSVGDYQITALSDGTVPQDLHTLLRGASKAAIDEMLAQSFHRNPVEASINAFLINTGSRLVLVDSGSGDFFGAGYGGKLVASLKAAGYEPSQINDILLTHVHTDHSGGLVHNGKEVFANALIHVGQPDVDFFMAPQNQNGVDGYDKSYFQQAVTALAPYKASGQLRPFNGVTEVLPGIRAIPTPGHTPGHAFYRVENKGQSITFVGDIAHVQSVQFPDPKITITYDVNQAQAARQRLMQFNLLSTQSELVAAAHLPFPGIGHIKHQGMGYAFVPVDYANRTGE